MRILKTELRLRLKNRKPRPFSRASSVAEAAADGEGDGDAEQQCSSSRRPTNGKDDNTGNAVDSGRGSSSSSSCAGGGGDSAISSPTTPNSSSLSSQTNLLNSPSPLSSCSTPGTPATPGAQQPAGVAGSGQPGSSGHKNSLKGTKLARRARSFKDDLFEKISLMRTPNNTLGRAHSPGSAAAAVARQKHGTLTRQAPTAEEAARSAQSLETHVKDITNALKHFRDVILKRKLEVLPGNGTVILETIASMYAVIQSYALHEQHSTVLVSATQQVYQSLGKLLKFCDEVMLQSDDAVDSGLSSGGVPLSDDHVKEVVDLLEDAVRNLVTLAQEKLKQRVEQAHKYGGGAGTVSAGVPGGSISGAVSDGHHLMRPPIEVAGQRTSLPDITLTPKERDILEKTNSNPIRASHSTESILRDTSPPPKPPLPSNRNTLRHVPPPPLPPKRRSQQQYNNNNSNNNNHNISINSDLDCSSDLSIMNYGVDHLSVRSRSPDENSSQCSLDSALNHSSRTEEELEPRLAPLVGRLAEAEEMHLLDDDEEVEKLVAYTATAAPTAMPPAAVADRASAPCVPLGVGAISFAAGMQNVAAATVLAGAAMPAADGGGGAVDKTDLRSVRNRHSNESGFVSLQSFRTSTQSVSKRSSDYSFHSSSSSSTTTTTTNATNKTSSSNNSEIGGGGGGGISAFGTIENVSASDFQFQQFHQQQQQRQGKEQLAGNTWYSSSTVSAADNHQSNNSGEHKSLNNHHKLNSLDHGEEIGNNDLPPALPPKSKRQLSQYDNFDEIDDANSFGELAELRHHHHQQQSSSLLSSSSQKYQNVYQWQSSASSACLASTLKHQSLIEPRYAGSLGDSGGVQPPPLPMKKKHILAYMEICSSTSTRSIEQQQQHRHTMHTYNVNQRSNITHSQTMNNMPFNNKEAKSSPEHEASQPPALPPKNYNRQQQRKAPSPSAIIATPTIITTPPPSPKPSLNSDGSLRLHGRPHLSSIGGGEMMTTVCEEALSDLTAEEQRSLRHSHQLPNAVETASQRDTERGSDAATHCNEMDYEGVDVALENHKNRPVSTSSSDSSKLPNMLEEIDIAPYISFKKEHEEGPEVKGGYIDALIVHASRVQKDNAFSEAFITTFRTFIQPLDVIEKLTHRYTLFFCQVNDEQKQKAAKETFSLLVRVVNDLTATDLTSELFALLGEFVYQLVCSGELYMAKLLRNKYVEKVQLYKDQRAPIYQPDTNLVTLQPSLLDLKSVEIAEQMTLLDAELFQKIEIPEVLLFAKEQCEDRTPNLNKFTEHFNKMSYWARSKILVLEDAKERERHVIKFIKIMKHLRKMNNYNSYLALLSALDSAPIRRLEWHKTITEGLKEYCTLIDSSSSFRVYRQALAETNPPCIPYIGLVLQDLTFVHVGNPDYLKDGVINFSKRWQQHNIIVNMKRFKKCSYPFRRNERIIGFFENFDKYLGEEEMWQISEHIKPRGKRPTHN